MITVDKTKKQNVLIVHNYYQIPGGEDTVVANEKKMLEEHGHKVILYSRNNAELKQMSKLQKLLLPVTTIFNPRTYREIKKLIQLEKIEIVHVHNTLNLISPAVYYAAKAMKVPVVQTIHNFRFVCPGATLYRNGEICEDCIKKGIFSSVKHNCYRKSRIQTLACVINLKLHSFTRIFSKINYICLTEFTKEKLSAFTKSARVFVKPNFVYDLGKKKSCEDYYLFVGRVEEIKGVQVLIDAFKRIPDKKLKIAGCGDLDEVIRSRIVEDRLDNIEMLGFKNRASLNELMRNAKALIMCSQWYETFGMVIAEAYSCGTPAIVGNIGNIKDLVIPGKTGELFDYDSPESMVAAIIRLESHDYEDYSRSAYEFYSKNLTSESNYRQLTKIYNQLS